MNNDQMLKDAVKLAVKRTIVYVKANHVGECLNGYALLTDDEMRTLGYLASTEEFTKSQSEPNVRFEPTDWIYADGASEFDGPAKILSRGADANPLSLHVPVSFIILVGALRELKLEGIFDDKVFLTVISTDPNEQLEKLEVEAVRALNDERMYSDWKASVA